MLVMSINRASIAEQKKNGLAGQFGMKTTSAPTTTLGVVNVERGRTGSVDEARRELREKGYKRATAGLSRSGSVRDVDAREAWWAEQLDRAEIAPEGKGYEMMPDDYSPGGHAGRGLSGKRRTYRKLYEGAGVSVRMPSATSIKSFSKDRSYETFDIPVQVEGKGGTTVSCQVRVTQTGPNSWSTQALNMPEGAAAKVSESVNAVLESRRPTLALKDVEKTYEGGLAERRKKRMETGGTKLDTIDSSSFIRAAGYNREAGEMYITLNERKYGYQVDQETYNYLRNSQSAGRVYNRYIKGVSDSFAVNDCGVCGNTFNIERGHACNGTRRPVDGVIKPMRERMRNRHLSILKNREQRATAKAEREARAAATRS